MEKTRIIVQELKKNDIQIPTVGEYCRENRTFDDTLIIGYGNHTEGELDSLVEELAAAVKTSIRDNTGS